MKGIFIECDWCGVQEQSKTHNNFGKLESRLTNWINTRLNNFCGEECKREHKRDSHGITPETLKGINELVLRGNSLKKSLDKFNIKASAFNRYASKEELDEICYNQHVKDKVYGDLTLNGKFERDGTKINYYFDCVCGKTIKGSISKIQSKKSCGCHLMHKDDTEEWKTIEGYSKYEVSNQGRLRNRETLKILKCRFNKGGYKRINSVNPSTKKVDTLKVHRIVATTFIPNPLSKPHVNHINGIKTDNRVENLEWVTDKENNNHYLFELRDDYLTKEQILEIRNNAYSKHSSVELADKYNCSITTIRNIISGKTYVGLEG